MAALSMVTVLFVFTLINLSGMFIIFAYLPGERERRLLLIGAGNKLLLSASWFLRFLDSINSVPGYQFWASFLIIGACAIEAGIYVGFMRRWKSLGLLAYGVISLVLATVIASLEFPDPSTSFYVQGIMVTLYLWLGGLYLIKPPRSGFRNSLALGYFLFPPTLMVAFYMVQEDVLYLYLNPSLWSVVLFAVAFMVQMLMIFGFVLISKERREEYMRVLAETDSLTGVANRRAFFQKVHPWLGSSGGQGKTVSIILMDLDHFKKINDTHGHDVGDRVIQHFCSIAQGSIRAKDLFARFGGEEFIAFLPDTSREEAVAICQRIQHRLHEAWTTPPETIPTYTVSLGVSTMNVEDSPTFTKLISQADGALYYSKEHGRDQGTWTDGSTYDPLSAA